MKFEILVLFVSFFALARERVFIKTHSFESRIVKGPEGVWVHVFEGVWVHFSARKSYRLGQ